MRSKVLTTPAVAAAAATTISAILLAAPAMAGPSRLDPDADHPLRIVHHVVAPVGRLVEWTVIRPIEAVGSRIAPYERIDDAPSRACARERPARSCAEIVR